MRGRGVNTVDKGLASGRKEELRMGSVVAMKVEMEGWWAPHLRGSWAPHLPLLLSSEGLAQLLLCRGRRCRRRRISLGCSGRHRICRLHSLQPSRCRRELQQQLRLALGAPDEVLPRGLLQRPLGAGLLQQPGELQVV